MTDKPNTFEENIEELEDIVRNLENGEISLKESLKTFQKGTELIKHCQKELQTTELEIKTVLEAEK
ncbi:MAG: exodeoxyribonuclease VII small subunit [Patescibacteria group bacterium]|jgi:exodeoxyribonuclease VII small subunit